MKRITLILLAFSLFACSEDDELLIRVKNTSQFEYIDLRVNTGGGEHVFGSIKSDETTAYKPYKSAYRYAFIELKIDGETYTLQPIDYVGETPLSKGTYTYEVNASNTGDRYTRLSINLKKD